MHTVKKNGSQTIIEATENMSSPNLLSYAWRQTLALGIEVWTHRELIQNLVIRDLKLRYKNSVLGVIWSLLNPLLMMIVFTTVFTVMQGQAIKNYPVFLLVGLLPWQFFATAVTASASSIVNSGSLINKVYFPREILVISIVSSNFVNYLIALLVLFPILFVFNIRMTQWILFLPLMILIQLIFTLGIGFITATTNVFYRDVQMLLDVLLLAGFFLTPIFYPMNILPRSYMLFGFDLDIWRLVYYLNPMASIIANYRVIIVEGAPPALDFLLRTLITSLICLATGLIVFHVYKSRFSEEI